MTLIASLRRSLSRRALVLAAWAATVATLGQPTLTRAADHFLTVGGGDSPSHNQVSLEKNVLYLQRVLDDIGIGQSHHDILFSDGNDPGRDLQAHMADPTPRVNLLLSRILGNNEAAVGIEYRSQSIQHVRAASNRKSLQDWFDQVGSKLADDDRLIIYFTGHGGGGKPTRNTTLTLWRENAMPVKEFVGLLDKLPTKVQVVMVMVQCHSGGFADVIFNRGDAGNTLGALSDHHRCGFFATVPERPAAGCTPDINEENYHEYSTYFWEAICGKSRLGKTISKPDYDGDGKVSFAEAHAYVKITSGTIDIPISTSDVFLRSFSRAPMLVGPSFDGSRPASGQPAGNRPLGRRGRDGPETRPSTLPATQPTSIPETQASAVPGTQPANLPETRPSFVLGTQPATSPATQPASISGTQPATRPTEAAALPAESPPPMKSVKPNLLSAEAPYYLLVETADPARKAVLDGLSQELKLEGPERMRGARDLLFQLQRKKDELEGQKRTARQNCDFARQKIAGALQGRWPELSVAYHPRQTEIIKSEADEVVKFIEDHEAYKQYESQREVYEKLDDQQTEADRKWVKTQRFLRTLDDVALAANLPKVASPEVVQKYKELLAAEYGTIGASDRHE